MIACGMNMMKGDDERHEDDATWELLGRAAPRKACEIEDVAEVWMLSAAAEHLDRFSDQELITMNGF